MLNLEEMWVNDRICSRIIARRVLPKMYVDSLQADGRFRLTMVPREKVWLA
jgi:hypothetical protein